MVGNVENDSTEKGYYDIPFDKYVAWLEKQKEQNWSKEMGSLCLDAIGLLKDYGEGVAKDSPLAQKIKRANAFLVDLYHEAFYPKTYNPRPDLMYKPTEWSEDIIRKAVKEVGLTQRQIDWFKTNVFPPKQEWSEKDEDCYSEICRIINNFADSPEQNRKLTDWLIKTVYKQ